MKLIITFNLYFSGQVCVLASR